jgi:polysaccharide export outer membrane protein
MIRRTLLLSLIFATTQALAQQRRHSIAEEASSAPEVSAERPVAALSGLGSPSPNLSVGPGDLLAINVFDTPELAALVRVSNSGEVSFPLLGTLHVAGLSAVETEALIAGHLRDGGYVLDPQVSILVREYATQAVSMLGEVRKPGPYPMLGSHTLLDLVTAAGGMTPTAGSFVSITHVDGTAPEIVQLNTAPGESWKTNPVIAPGDRIEIPRAPIVYVAGEVGRPGGFVMTDHETLTVLKALALADGTKPGASLSKARLLRKNASGVQNTPLPLKQMLAGRAPDMELRDNDMLFIPNHGAMSFAARTAETLLAVASSSVIYAATR